MSLELMLFFIDPRLANSYMIHFYGKNSYESNASEREKSIESLSYNIPEQFLQIKEGLSLLL
jgi:hypothetical protein